MTMTIGKKISLACIALVGLTVVQAVVSALYIGRLSADVRFLVEGPLPAIYSLGVLHGYEKEQKVAMLAHIASGTAQQKSKLETTIAGLESNFQTEMKVYEKTTRTTKSRELIAQLRRAQDRFNQMWEARIMPLSRALRTKDAMSVWDGEALGPFQERSRIFREVIEDRNNQGQETGGAAIATARSAQVNLLLILLLSVASGGAMAFFIIRGINKVLTHAVVDLSEGAEQVASAAGQVSGSSQSLAQGASEQAASLEETSASSEEMSSMTRKNSENSQQAAQFMNSVNQRVVEANRTLADMMISMREIGVSSNKISKIIRVIDEIAFQTNILALNAAVEAARAGEAGMGFAVVADEVRNLAQRSAQAAKDTTALIEESMLKSADGSTRLSEVAASIQAITEGAGKVKTLVDEVEASSKEQAQGIEQISKAVSQMDEVTQRTAASAEESASASEELNAQSQALVAVVEQLQRLIGGNAARSTPTTGRRKRDAENPRPEAIFVRNARGSNAGAASSTKSRSPSEFPLDDTEFREF